MRSAGIEKIQLGQSSLLLGIWPNMLAGAIKAKISMCLQCGKLEFYAVDEKDGSEGEIASIQCPQCGCTYEMDDPKCPRCGYNHWCGGK